MADVFISYSSEDREDIKVLVDCLVSTGCTVWYDRDLVGGSVYSEEIEREINASSVVLTIWTESSIKSHWVADESLIGCDANKYIPISLDGTPPPIGFRQYQEIDFSEWNGRIEGEQFRQLLKSLERFNLADTLVEQPARDSIAGEPKERTPNYQELLSKYKFALVFAALLIIIVGLSYFPRNGDEERSGLPTTSEPNRSEPTTVDAHVTGPLRTSIAVLPFSNISGDPENLPFAEGIHDDLLTAISKIKSIRTVSRTSVLQYRGTEIPIPTIAEDLGVATILEGGIQRSGDRIRINVQLIGAVNDEHLWAETYDFDLNATNVFTIQSEITRAIAAALRVTLSVEDESRLEKIPTESLEALDAYFQGKQFLLARTTESLHQAISFFERAIELDSEFALAYSGLADAYLVLPEYSPDISRELVRNKSDAAASRALSLDPNLPEALRSVGWVRLIHEYDWAEAERYLRRAVEIHPENGAALHWLSHVLSWQKKHDEAIQIAERALIYDPESPLIRINLGYIFMDLGEFDLAIQINAAVTEEFPNYNAGRRNLWLTNFRAGNFKDGAEEMVEWARRTGRDAAAARIMGDLIIDHQRNGTKFVSNPELFERLQLGTENEAQVRAVLGDEVGTLKELEKALLERSGSRSVLSMGINPVYDFIRDDPRFADLLDRAGLGHTLAN